MEKRKECWLKLVAGLGWAGFGAVLYRTAAVSVWISLAAMVLGAGLVMGAVDMALEPKRW